ncbi:REP element-mobilizing transposase RayT [Pseudomonas sp. BIGb0408]|uniref:REP element-mobilizing transposase RayT n=2 Tax=Pseudomonadales TaxID=72274 RepID=A0A7Y9XTD2_9GAMM|nr:MULTISPECIES: transposase [Pseudomonas]MCW2294989.1 REP element-mobilizing transposase RayT [Pseudomonas sp. BIGb0408]NYH75737.1 REP element-mobilizing transposase RayT [Pseudomonas flavescens]
MLMSSKPGYRALRRGRASCPAMAYLITTITRDRQPVFSHFAAGCAAARCFETPMLLRDSRMLAWVLMPDHVHWLVQLGEADSLAALINRLKSSSSRLAGKNVGRAKGIWQAGFHDHGLRAEEDLLDVARYIVSNPLRAGLVRRVGDYPFWNAVWL